MFVSGSLKDKSIDFYREKVTSFDKNGINTDEVYFSYKGEITFAPWDKDKEKKLITHEEKHIEALDEKIHGIFKFNDKCGTEFFYFNTEVGKLIKKIRSFDRNISYVLLETLYKNLSRSTDRILTITSFNKLLTYLEDKYLDYDQSTIDIIMKLYTNGYKYDERSVHRYKVKTFYTDENKIERSENYALYKLGEFTSPYRLSRIGFAVENECSTYVLPIYFLIKDEKKAEKFLQLCRVPELDREHAIKSAESLDVSKNIIRLVK